MKRNAVSLSSSHTPVAGLLLLLLVMAVFLIFWRRSQRRKAAAITSEVNKKWRQIVGSAGSPNICSSYYVRGKKIAPNRGERWITKYSQQLLRQR
jgi:hypothetical protein